MDRQFCAQLNELLKTTYRAMCTMEEGMLSDLSEERLTIGEMHIIEAIGSEGHDPHARGRGKTISEIAQLQSISPPSVTVAVKKLERKGYVYKSRGADDGRRIYVHLTESGIRADISHRYFHRQMAYSIARAIPEAEHEALIEGLRALNSFIQGKVADMDAVRASGQRTGAGALEQTAVASADEEA